MAHKEKYTKGAVGHMFAHYERSKNVPDLFDAERTVLNYNLAEDDQPKGQLEFLHQRLSEVKVHNRKDVNVMVDWVVTLPKSLTAVYETKKFFVEAYKFLNGRYGKENVISAYVHLDEVTPHMHYAFVPVISDKKTGGYKLSAKEVVTRKDLQTFHQDLSKYMQEVFKRDIGILNEATKEGNKSIAELKRETATERLKDLNFEIQTLEKQKKALETQIEGLQSNLEAAELSIVQILDIQPKRGLAGGVSGISLEQVNKLKEMAIDGIRVKSLVDRYKAESNRLAKLVPSVHKRLEQVRVERIVEEYNALKEKVDWVLTTSSLRTRSEIKESLRIYELRSAMQQEDEEPEQEQRHFLAQNPPRRDSGGFGFDR